MLKSDFTSWVEQNINAAAQAIVRKDSISDADEAAFGRLSFYLVLHRQLQNKSTPQDLGLLDAVNDTLQQLSLLESKRTLLSDLQTS